MFLKIVEKKEKFDRIVCISRGGLVVARIFSDYLRLPISSFTIVSYVKVGKTGKPLLKEKLKVNIRKEKILLIDEIVDDGTTLRKAIDYLTHFKPKKIVTLCPIIKKWSQIKPNYWLIETDKWVVFPYEVRETVEDLVYLWTKEGLEEREIQKKLKRIGLPVKQVDYFLKKTKI